MILITNIIIIIITTDIIIIIIIIIIFIVGRDSVDSVAIRYGTDGQGLEYRWERGFLNPSRPDLEPTNPLYIGYRVLPWGKAAGAWR